MDQKEKPVLRLKVKLPKIPIARSHPGTVLVRLINVSQKPVVVNQRMAVGYRDHLARELFADLLEAESDQPVQVLEVDYDRQFSPPSDFVSLMPGQEVRRSINLFDYYLPLRPGMYRLILFYQADEPLAHPLPGIAPGIYPSDPVDIVVE